MNKRKAPAKRGPKPSEQQIAAFVRGTGSDEEIAALCADNVDGWAELSPKAKADMVRLMRKAEGNKLPPALAVRTDDNDVSRIGTPEGANVTLNALRLTDALASYSQEYVDDRVSDLTMFPRSGPKGGLKPRSESLSAALAFVAGGNATDTVQSTLLVQMAATHDAAMRALGALGRAEYMEQAKVWGNVSAKLLNAYTRQAETLAKLQRGGEQIVKHIHLQVNDGGQAVVAEQIVTGGGVNGERRNQAYEQSALSPALLGSDPFGNVVPMSSREGAEAMPIARGRTGKRRTGGK